MSMKSLAELQQTFQSCVLYKDMKASTEWVSASGRAEPQTQVAVYRYAYRARLKEVLASDFPAGLLALGEEAFDLLVEDYIRTHPSRYFSLREFGRQLPAYVDSLFRQQRAYHDQPWLMELLRFEWTLGEAFDAADASVVMEQDMAAVPPEAWPELRFILHPSVHRLDLEWNIPAMWSALTSEPPTPVSAEREAVTSWLIWREQLVTRFRSLSLEEQLALDTLAAGKDFNDICEVLATQRNMNEVPLYAASLLKGWLAQGLISELKQ